MQFSGIRYFKKLISLFLVFYFAIYFLAFSYDNYSQLPNENVMEKCEFAEESNDIIELVLNELKEDYGRLQSIPKLYTNIQWKVMNICHLDIPIPPPKKT